MNKLLSYTIILFVLFISSGSSDLANHKNVLITGWLFFTTAHIYNEKLIKFQYLKILGIFAVISVVYFLLNGAYDAVTYLGFFIKVSLAYYCRDICKDQFVPYFINIVFVGTCISFPLYIVQLINFDFLYRYNNLMGLSTAYEAVSSSIFFSMVPIHAIRNCGFMWEPGAFAAVLILSIYLNTFREKETLFSIKNTIFILAIFTTQSTMGVLSLLIPIILVLNESFAEHKALRQLAVLIIPAMLIIFYAVFSNVKFLSEKIGTQIVELDEELAFIERGNKENFIVSTTRLASITLDYETIKNYPILGLGIDMRTTSRSKLAIGENTITSCGLTLLAIRFGILGFIGYVYLLYRSALFEKKIHKIGWVFLVFFILFSNELSASAFLHLFIF